MNGIEYRYYDWTDRNPTGDKFIVYKKGGITTEYTAVYDTESEELYFESKQGEKIWGYDELSCKDDQETDHWLAGNTYYVTIEYQNVQTKIEVQVVKKSASLGGGVGAISQHEIADAEPVQSGNLTSIDLSADVVVEGNKTTTTIEKQTADKVVNVAAQNESKEIVINVVNNNQVISSDIDEAMVELPADMIEAIAENTESDLIVRTDVAEVKLDNMTAKAVAAQVQKDSSDETKTVIISVEKNKEDTTEIRYEFMVLTSSGNVISDFNGGNATITVKVPASLQNKELVCVYIDENGFYHQVSGKLNADGTYSFITGHFSTYALLSKEDVDKAITKQKNAVKSLKLKLRSQLVKTKSGKKAIKITWTNPSDIELEGIEIFRSLKEKFRLWQKPIFISKDGKYTNSAVKKGNKYYL